MEQGKWSCQACTLENDQHVVTCVVCGTRRRVEDVSVQDYYEEEDDDEEYLDEYDSFGDFSVNNARRGGRKNLNTKRKQETPFEEYQVKGEMAWHLPSFCKEFKARVRKFRIASHANKTLAQDKASLNECKLLLVHCLEYFKYKYFDEGKASVDRSQVRLQFMQAKEEESEGGDIHCRPWTGIIRFGEGILKKEFFDGSQSRYSLENEYLKRSPVKDKEGLVFWFLLHEYLHLFSGYDKHNEDFFACVLYLSRQELFLFETP